MKARGRIHIGTSGWNYDGWKGPFYPEKIPQKELLCEYAKTFETVEVNSSFYRLPSAKSVKSWVDKTPDGFCFSCKASRYITHMKKLKEPEVHIGRLMEAFAPFGRKCGLILFQLPPRWKVNFSRLEEFLKELPDTHRYAFEFRNNSWLCEEIFKLLEKNNAALCFYDYKEFRSPERPTADFIYIRLHGPRAEPYAGSYDETTLSDYARKCCLWADEGKDVFCYFDNDQKSCAPFDAQKLIKRINQTGRETENAKKLEILGNSKRKKSI